MLEIRCDYWTSWTYLFAPLQGYVLFVFCCCCLSFSLQVKKKCQIIYALDVWIFPFRCLSMILLNYICNQNCGFVTKNLLLLGQIWALNFYYAILGDPYNSILGQSSKCVCKFHDQLPIWNLMCHSNKRIYNKLRKVFLKIGANIWIIIERTNIEMAHKYYAIQLTELSKKMQRNASFCSIQSTALLSNYRNLILNATQSFLPWKNVSLNYLLCDCVLWFLRVQVMPKSLSRLL